jgi:hypothetical protein
LRSNEQRSLHCFDAGTFRARDFDVSAPGVYASRIELRGIDADRPDRLTSLAADDLWFTSR